MYEAKTLFVYTIYFDRDQLTGKKEEIINRVVTSKKYTMKADLERTVLKFEGYFKDRIGIMESGLKAGAFMISMSKKHPRKKRS